MKVQVKVNNYYDLEKVETQILILKGYIDSEDTIDNIEVKVLAVGGNTVKTPRSGVIKIIQNCFSVIVKLFEGKNLIIFQRNEEFIKRMQLIFESTGIPDTDCSHVKPVVVLSTYGAEFEQYESLEASYFRRIQTGLKLIQWYFSEKLFEAGFPRRSFNLDSCSLFMFSITPNEIHEMEANEVWEALAREIKVTPELWNEKRKYVAFLRHPWKKEPNSGSEFAVPPRSALAGGGLVLLDHTLSTFWPDECEDIFLTLENELEVTANDGSSLTSLMTTVSRQFGATLGIVAHEMGHVFDLGHTELGLMGKDFHRFALTVQPKLKGPLGSRTRKVYLATGSISEDPVQFSPSCLTLLYYNRWFNSHGTPVDSDSKISLSKNKISSPFPISVIEVRDPESGCIFSSWTERHQARTSFLLYKRFVPEECLERELELVVQDTSGGILKTKMVFSQLLKESIKPLK